jgi:hypothetical protein
MGDRLRYVRLFATRLGWHKLVRHRHVRADGGGPSPIEWFESHAAGDVVFQINCLPVPSAAVFAMRYRICSAWHRFDASNRSLAISESARLCEVLDRNWFSLRESRREFRAKYPQCANYSFRRLRTQGPPFELR